LGHRHAAGLDGEVDDGGGAAPGGGAGARFEGVGGDGPAEGEFHVDVGVDAAGDDEAAGGVDDLVGLAGQVAADGRDGVFLAEDVRHVVIAGGDDSAVLDEGRHSVML